MKPTEFIWIIITITAYYSFNIQVVLSNYKNHADQKQKESNLVVKSED